MKKNIVIKIVWILTILLFGISTVSAIDGAVLYWHFDDNSTDIFQGRKLNTTAGGFSTGLIGNAIYLTEETLANDTINESTLMTSISVIDFWIFINQTATNQAILGFGQGSGLSSELFDCRIEADSTLDCESNLGGTNWHLTTTDFTNQIDSWTHIIITQNASHTSLFINGTLNVTDVETGIFLTQREAFFYVGSSFRGDSALNQGMIDNLYISNQTGGFNQANVTCSFNSGAGFDYIGDTSCEGIAESFDITAIDLYDSTILNNFTITISNSTDSYTNTTTTGSISFDNISTGIYNITFFNINDSGGYFNGTFVDVDVSTDFEVSLFQSVLNLQVIDTLDQTLVSSFTAVTNRSTDTTTSGIVLIEAKKGYFELNVTSVGFELLQTNFSLIALQNKSFNVSLGSLFTFNLIREETNTPFNVNATNETKLNVFCPNSTNVITFINSSNSSSIINCQFTLMQIIVDYGATGSYFRTLIPPFSQKNITFFLIDLDAGDIAIQKIIQLLDLTGDFANSILTVKRAVGGIISDIIEQRFDISKQANLFLVKDSLYSISIENDVEEIILGNLIPTEAGTQTITLPNIQFVPSVIILGDNISWSYTFNTTTNILRLQYVDKTNLTELVRFTITDSSNSQVFQGESDNNSTVTFTYNSAIGNETYSTELFFEHPSLSNHTELKIFYDFLGAQSGAIDLEGWTQAEQIDIKKWAAIIILAIVGMIFTTKYSGLAAVSMIVLLWIFRNWKWLEVNNIIFGFLVLLAIGTWMLETSRRN